MNILQNIFSDHYEEIEYLLHPRPVVMENISKMINCGDPVKATDFCPITDGVACP